VRWDGGVAHPPVVACLIRVGRGSALVEMGDVVLRQNDTSAMHAADGVESNPATRRRGAGP
jgi:hypothetical protein